MALFKINKGSNTKRLTDSEALDYIGVHDGYCYFDTSTKFFFIDAEITDDNGVTTVVRAPLNANQALRDIQGNRIDTTYLKSIDFTPLSLGIGYGVCTSAFNETIKIVTIPDLVLQPNGLVLIQFIEPVDKDAVLKINDNTARKILLNGANITNDIIQAKDICLFFNGADGFELLSISNHIVSKADINSPNFTGIPNTPTPTDSINLMQIVNVEYVNKQIKELTGNVSDDFSTLEKIETQIKLKADKVATIAGELVQFPTIGEGTLTISKNGTVINTFNANSSQNIAVNIEVPTDLSQLTNGPGYKTTDHNTTYTLTGNDRTITLTPSNGTAMSYTIPESIVNGGTITGPLETEDLTTKQYISFKDSTGTILGKIGYASSTNPVLYIGESANQIYHSGNLDEVTTTVAGLMSAEDKVKLDSISAEATKYTPPEYTSYASGLYKITTNKYGHIAAATAVTGHDIEDILGYTPSDNEHTHLYAGSESVGGPANSVKESLSFAVGGVEKGSYNGSEGHRIEINAVDLNISSALKYIGRTNNEPVDSVITLVSGNQVIAEPGNVVIWTEGNIEYLFDDDYNWVKLGEASSFSLAPHIHGNISNQGYLTDENGLSLSNRILTTDGTGYIHGVINFSDTVTQKFLNENGSWQQVNVDNFYHGTGVWGGQDGLTYSAQAYGGAPAFEFTLPTVSAEQKGVVGIGSNITLTSGIISITKENVETALGFTPLASTTKYALSDSVGGDALKAKKMSFGAGNAKLPIYIANDGTPTEIDSTDVAISINGSAAKWAEKRTITLTGDVEGTIVLDGSENVEAEIKTGATNSNGYVFRVDYVTSNSDTVLNIPLAISEFLLQGANLQLYQNGILLLQDEHYSINEEKTVVTLIGYPFEAGDSFTFIGISGIGFQSEDMANAIFLPKTGGVMSGAITLAGSPTSSLHATSKQYVDESITKNQQNNEEFVEAALTNYVKKIGDTMTGNLILNGENCQIIKANNGCSYWNGRDEAIICQTTTGTSYYPIISSQTNEGSWDIATYSGNLRFTYVPNTTYNAGANGGQVTSIYMSPTGVLYGAAWNDYAEYRQANSTEPGRCIVEVGDDTLALATKRMQPGASIISDTFGFAIGETDKACTPIAVSGRVLAYGYEDRDAFRKAIGRPVCSGPNGTVSIMTDEEYQKYGYCAIGTVSAVPNYEVWGYNNIKVNNRIWIKVV